MLGPESYPRRSARILAQHAADTLVLLSLDGGEYYALNAVGRRVWELCDGTRSVATIVAILGHEYEAPADTIAADVFELLRDLVHEKLVDAGDELAGGAAPA
jgi:coenzyme PQQ biosynthesis protein PqqD